MRDEYDEIAITPFSYNLPDEYVTGAQSVTLVFEVYGENKNRIKKYFGGLAFKNGLELVLRVPKGVYYCQRCGWGNPLSESEKKL